MTRHNTTTSGRAHPFGFAIGTGYTRIEEDPDSSSPQPMTPPTPTTPISPNLVVDTGVFANVSIGQGIAAL